MECTVVLSEHVWKVYESVYGLQKTALSNILFCPPIVSTIRFNGTQIEKEDAGHVLQDYMKSLAGLGEFVVQHHPLLDDVLVVGSIGKCKNCVKPVQKEVIVDALCGAAVLRGADVFAPGVLAAHPGMKEGDVVSVYADVRKMCRRGLVQKFEGDKIHVGNGLAMFARNALFEQNIKHKGVAVKVTHHIYPLPSFANLNHELFFPQNFPSCTIAHALKPLPEATVLDMCSSPGGKSTHVAAMLQNKGIVISIDKTPAKVRRVMDNADRLNLSNIRCFAYDSTKLCSGEPISNPDDVTFYHLRGPPFPCESFDYIMLDPPCSGLGQRPQLHVSMSLKDLSSYPIYQKKLFQQAVRLLRANGRLVYSTCTVRPEENEEIVNWALSTFKELTLVDEEPRFGLSGLSGYGLDDSNCRKVRRFDACFRNSRKDSMQCGCEVANAECNANITSTNSLSVTALSETVPVLDSSKILELCDQDTIGFFCAVFVKR